MNVIIALICMDIGEMWRTGSKLKKNKNANIQRDSNLLPIASETRHLDHSAILTADELCLKVLNNPAI